MLLKTNGRASSHAGIDAVLHRKRDSVYLYFSLEGLERAIFRLISLSWRLELRSWYLGLHIFDGDVFVHTT